MCVLCWPRTHPRREGVLRPGKDQEQEAGRQPSSAASSEVRAHRVGGDRQGRAAGNGNGNPNKAKAIVSYRLSSIRPSCLRSFLTLSPFRLPLYKTPARKKPIKVSTTPSSDRSIQIAVILRRHTMPSHGHKRHTPARRHSSAASRAFHRPYIRTGRRRPSGPSAPRLALLDAQFPLEQSSPRVATRPACFISTSTRRHDTLYAFGWVFD